MAREAKILLGNCFLYSELKKEKQEEAREIKTKASAPENGDIFSFKKRIKEKKSSVFFTRSGRRAKNFLSYNFSSKKNHTLWNETGKAGAIDGLVYKKWPDKKNVAHNYYKIGAEMSEWKGISGWKNRFSLWTADIFRKMPLIRAWNISLAAAMIFGMFATTMTYHYLGQNVSARMQLANSSAESNNDQGRVLGEENFNESIDPEYITKILSEDIEGGKELSSDEFEKKLRSFVKGYPIEQMVPYIAKQNHITAAFMIAIARKESSWGVHVPVLDGQDCFNYWGFRAIRPRMGTGGHTCFDSPEDAVNSVAKRIDVLVSKEGLDTPEKMIVWKCGYDCSWDNQAAMKKWISDVDKYFQQLN